MKADARYASYLSLHGRGVFVTGGATGIGAELVTQFARQGAQVGFVDIQPAAAAGLAAKLAAEQGAARGHETSDGGVVPRGRPN